MSTHEILFQLDQLIQTHAVLQHPFYQAWSAGQLTREDLAVFSWVYYPHVEAFPGYIEMALGLTDHPRVLLILEENLKEELGEPIPHAEHWLYFAEGLGVTRQEVIDAAPIPEVEQTIAIFRDLCCQDAASALSALYAYESQQPDICRENIAGLCRYYQVHSQQMLSYFMIHEEADIRHREETRQALGLFLAEGIPSQTIFEATQRALDAHWLLLDGVSRQAGLASSCPSLSFFPCFA